MNYPELITFVTIILYMLASGFGIAGMLSNRVFLQRLGCHFALGAFFCQTFTLISGFHKSTSGFLSTGAWLQLPAWFILLCGSAAWWRLRQNALLLFAAPFGLTLFLMSLPWLNVPLKIPAQLSTSFYILHTGAIFMALGLLCVAFIAGIIFLALEKRLKTRLNLKGFWQEMPSLTLLDKINSVCVLASFPLYTLGLLAGAFWSTPIYGKALSGDPKEYMSILIWFLLAFVFHKRLGNGWKGKKPALIVIAVFSLSLLSLLAINFLLPGHHSFMRA